MKYLFAAVALAGLALPTQAETLIEDISLTGETLTITAVPGEQMHTVVELPEPGISAPVYALKGMIRYDGVQGEAYLQLDNNFGSRGSFFTKSVAAAGPLGKITGSSDWRPFVLPFQTSQDEQADGNLPLPDKLTLSLHLPGSGTVSVSEMGLYQYAQGENPLQMHTQAGQWFSNQTAGWIGGIGGTLLGLWGAMIGILSSRGKARSFVVGSANGILVIGIGSLLAGVVALSMAQPYAVYFPFLLMGIIIVAVIGVLYRTLSARYEQVELQRMQSMDA